MGQVAHLDDIIRDLKLSSGENKCSMELSLLKDSARDKFQQTLLTLDTEMRVLTGVVPPVSDDTVDRPPLMLGPPVVLGAVDAVPGDATTDIGVRVVVEAALRYSAGRSIQLVEL